MRLWWQGVGISPSLRILCFRFTGQLISIVQGNGPIQHCFPRTCTCTCSQHSLVGGDFGQGYNPPLVRSLLYNGYSSLPANQVCAQAWGGCCCWWNATPLLKPLGPPLDKRVCTCTVNVACLNSLWAISDTSCYPNTEPWSCIQLLYSYMYLS